MLARNLLGTCLEFSMLDMSGRPGCRTMEMFGAYPSHPLICAYFHRVGSKERFRLPGRAGSTSIVRWTLRPVIFGVEICSELGARSEFARNSLGKRPGPAMRGPLQVALRASITRT